MAVSSAQVLTSFPKRKSAHAPRRRGEPGLVLRNPADRWVYATRAHVGEERALGPVRCLGRIAREAWFRRALERVSSNRPFIAAEFLIDLFAFNEQGALKTMPIAMQMERAKPNESSNGSGAESLSSLRGHAPRQRTAAGAVPYSMRIRHALALALGESLSEILGWGRYGGGGPGLLQRKNRKAVVYLGGGVLLA